MTTQTLNTKSPVIQANEDPCIQNFNYLYTTNKVDVLSDILANIVIGEFNTDFYRQLSDSDKELVQLAFNNKLSAHSVVIDSETITMCENNGMLNLANILKNYNASNSVFSETATNIEPDQKVTIITLSDFCFPVLINTTIEDMTIKPYAQYKDSLFITHKPKSKRKSWELIIRPYQSFMIYDGWLNTDIDNISKVTVSSNSSVTVTTTKYHSFDKRFLSDLLSAISETPLVTFNIKEAVTV